MRKNNIMDDHIDSSRFWTWERAARAAIFAQVIITIAVAIYFAVVTSQQNHVLAAQTLAATRSNRAIIHEVRVDLDTHAHASAARNCSVAKLLNYLAKSSALPRSPAQFAHITDLVHEACTVVPIGATTG